LENSPSALRRSRNIPGFAGDSLLRSVFGGRRRYLNAPLTREVTTMGFEEVADSTVKQAMDQGHEAQIKPAIL
jgi:hypothetical protein